MSSLLNKITGRNTHDVAEKAGETHTAKHEQVADHTGAGTTTTVTQTTTQPNQNQAGNYGQNTNITGHHGAGTGTQFYTEQPNVGQGAAANNTGFTGDSNAATGHRFTTGAVPANTGSVVGGNQSNYVSGANAQTHNTGLNAASKTMTSTTQTQQTQQPVMHSAQPTHQSNIGIAKSVQPVGAAALNKYVTTEHVNTQVPVQREVPILEREPITDANRGQALSGPTISEGHYETTLNQEQVHASKEAVPIERIRLGKQVETSMQPVSAEMRKEHIEYPAGTMGGEKIDNLGGNNVTSTTTSKTIY